MTARVRVRPEAEADLADAYHWYEESRQGLGARFLKAVRSSLRAIASHPEAYPTIHLGIRRLLLRRFPYGLFYHVTEEEVVVLACFHIARDPKAWQDRTRDQRDA